ncbi:MAG: MBL fold metallo-hydrolase [Chitinophagales bacterium]|nr:MBL fold metallo-hydrolase [Chitinophagales bacterium]
MKLHTIETGLFKLDGGAMFGVVPKAIWQNFYPADSNNRCTWSMRSLLIEEGDRLILIDCGLGNKQSEKFFSHFEPHGDDSLEKSLHANGFHRNDITDVILTHLHFDHCGGAVIKNSDGNPEINFPNAVYWSHEKHWDWALDPNPRERASFLKENILPIQESGQLKFIDKDDFSMDTISFKSVDGHTEKMVLPMIQYKERTVAYMADLLPSPHHIPIPYVMAYDIRPLVSIDEKSVFLKEAFENEYVLFFEHDQHIECCDLRNTDKGIRMDKSFTLSAL